MDTSTQSDRGPMGLFLVERRLAGDDRTRSGRVTCSEYGTVQETLAHYRDKYGTPERKGDRLVFGPKLINPGKGEYQASMIFADGKRWAATAAGKSE